MTGRRRPEYEELSPYLLLRELPSLAENRISPSLASYCERSGMNAWELLEEGVFYFFRQNDA